MRVVAQDIGSDRRIASLVGGRYQITGLIASGGMGEVFQAHDKVLDRTVALKVLRAGIGSDTDFIERFRKEATIAGRLSHPNIVQVYDWGRGDDGSAYMAMEFVDGQNLREVLTANGRLRPSIASRIATQVCAALEAARKAGLVHRDVKPENILLTADGGVKVADFGLSRTMAESRATQAGVLMGTAHYLAPEQVEGDPSDHRADIYALGIVLYEMLTGETPFTGDNPLVIAYQRVRHDVPAPSARIGGIPSGLDQVVARATVRDADKRFPSAAEMAEALRSATPRSDTGELTTLVHPTTAIPVGTQETIQLKRKRGPRLTRRGIIVIAAILAAVLASIPLLTGALAHVDVPNVAGRPKAAAQTALEKAGFKVTTETENHPQIPIGTVIRTDPPAETSIRKGSTVKLIVSAGPVTVQVPNVRGFPFADAEKQLTDRGLEVVKVEQFHATITKGLVIDQDHDPGVIITQDTPVTLTVSKGKERVNVPDVVGKSEADATQILTTAGFTVRVERVDHDTVPAGRVIDQAPKKGVKADRGSEVKIVVSNGPPKVTVPSILCMTRTQAAHTIAAAGLTINFVGEYSRVVDQSPPPDSTAPRGSVVNAYTAPGGASCS
ncbi:MAG: Stk1 family PASTA domain-containing Ser/Thr kinase [Actinomycetota bacterium]